MFSTAATSGRRLGWQVGGHRTSTDVICWRHSATNLHSAPRQGVEPRLVVPKTTVRPSHSQGRLEIYWLSSTGGTRTHTHQVLRLVALPSWRTVPWVAKRCRDSIAMGATASASASPMGFEPTISCVTGRRALRCSTRTYVSSSGGSRTHSIPGSKPRWSANCLPSR